MCSSIITVAVWAVIQCQLTDRYRRLAGLLALNFNRRTTVEFCISVDTKLFSPPIADTMLPAGFVRIRHYGILSSSWKRGKLQALQSQLNEVVHPMPVKTLLHQCPVCKTGILITIEVFSKRGPPSYYLRKNPPAPVS